MVDQILGDMNRGERSSGAMTSLANLGGGKISTPCSFIVLRSAKGKNERGKRGKVVGGSTESWSVWDSVMKAERKKGDE